MHYQQLSAAPNIKGVSSCVFCYVKLKEGNANISVLWGTFYQIIIYISSFMRLFLKPLIEIPNLPCFSSEDRNDAACLTWYSSKAAVATVL